MRQKFDLIGQKVIALPGARIYVRENHETEAVSAFLNGKVPEQGSNVVELVRKNVSFVTLSKIIGSPSKSPQIYLHLLIFQ